MATTVPAAFGSSTTAATLSVEGWLVAGVLRAVERSAAYADPTQWTRPVVVRWATAWSLDPQPEDAERARARLRAARWLTGAGGGTVTYDKPPYDDRPRTIHCTATQCIVLEDLARTHGIVPLRDTLATLRATWLAAAAAPSDGPIPTWWRQYEATLERALTQPVPTGIGIAAERLGEGWVEWLDSVKAARGIAAGVCGYERVVSERLLGYSKRLADLRRLVAAHLIAADPQWAERVDRLPTTVLAAYGVRRVPPALDVAGPITIAADGSTMDLSRIEGLARLPGAWAIALAGAARAASIATVTTIENETSAWAYLEERGGPAGLAAARELVVYTSGFAASIGAVAISQLWAALPTASFRHWGDADAAGLQIWLDLQRRSGAPLRWWRTTGAWVEDVFVRGAGTPLSVGERRSLEQIVERLRADAASDPDGLALACGQALLRAGVRIEQEAFEPGLDAIDRG